MPIELVVIELSDVMECVMQTVIISDPFYKKHLTGRGHPECPERYESIINALQKAGLKTSENSLLPRRALEEEILLCHTPNYYKLAEKDIQRCKESGLVNGQWTLCTGDVQVCPDSWEAAHLAAGGVMVAVDGVMSKQAKNAFCVVRPPGHHATPQAGMGFCLFNNVAIGARYLQKKYGIGKVLIVDWDVHHGNGTQDIFEEDPSVFYFSTHQAHIYPGTGFKEERGKEKAVGTILNFPIESNSQSRINVLNAFTGPLVEAMESFRPEFIFISAGFDAHKDDPLGGFNLTDQDFVSLTEVIKKLAEQYSEARIVSVLEGGYNLQALASASVAHVKSLQS